jgi:hypothetical protein
MPWAIPFGGLIGLELVSPGQRVGMKEATEMGETGRDEEERKGRGRERTLFVWIASV